jgi:hypothetical protein
MNKLLTARSWLYGKRRLIIIERKAKGFSAVAMPASMPFFLFPTKTGK